jgi:hypothetical protein
MTRHRRAMAAVAGAALLAGCGYATQSASPAPVPPAAAVSASNGCARAAHVVGAARGVLAGLNKGSLPSGQARRLLGTDQAALGALARGTAEPVLQENLALAYDAVTAFRAVMRSPAMPAYQQTLATLTGTLAGFGRVCSVGAPGAATGPRGWTASAVTLRGSAQVGLWAHAVSGAPALTLQVTELSGKSVVGTQRVTMRLDRARHFETLTYHVRHPGASSLRVSVYAATTAPGERYVVDGLTVVHG